MDSRNREVVHAVWVYETQMPNETAERKGVRLFRDTRYDEILFAEIK